MEHVNKTSRKTRTDGSVRPVQAAPKPLEITEETGARSREVPVNASVFNSKVAPVLTRPLESSLELNTDSKVTVAAADIAAAAAAYAQSSAAAFAIFSHGSTFNQPVKDHSTSQVGQWGWNRSTEPFEQQSMSPGLPPGYSGVSHAGRSSVSHGIAAASVNINLHDVGATSPSISTNGWTNVNKKVSHDMKSPYGPGFLEEDWEELSPPAQIPSYAFTTRKVVKLDERGFPISSSETINPVAPPKSVGNLPVSANFRLASPTPTDEDVEPEIQKGKTQPGQQPFQPPPESSDTISAVTAAFYKTLNTHIDEAGRAHYASAPLVAPASGDQDLSLNFEQPKNQMVSGPITSNLRSRDPRRQLQNGLTEEDVPLHQPSYQPRSLGI